MKSTAHMLGCLALLMITARAFAQGGPPVITDDPWTPRPNHWEINSGWTVEKAPGHSKHELPSADLNYGWGKRVQLKLEVPYVIASDAYVTHAGVGNFEAGVKWRFLENFIGLAISTYPQLVIPRFRSAAASIGTSTDWQLLLPIEIARNIGRFDLDAEAGYWFGPPAERVTMGGLALGFEVSHGLEFVGECNAQGVRLFAPAELACGGGVRADITEHTALMGAFEPYVGGNAEDRPHLRTYLGVQAHVRGGGLWKGRRRQ